MPGSPYGRHFLDEEDIQAVVDVLRGDWLTQGPTVQRFERALAEYCGAKHAIAVSNGTAALHLACLAAGLGPGDEGITSPITFLASANCLIYCGAKPVFADIDGETWDIDPREIEKHISDKTRVIIPVHFGGLPCDMDVIRGIADKHGLIVIEDACHALGALYKGKRIGGTGLAEMTCFSFHPMKHITTGEGGAVLTDDDGLAAKLRMLRHHGITRNPEALERDDGPWYHEAHVVGYNARITDIQSALGLSQLGKLDQFIERRRVIARNYDVALAGFSGVKRQQIPDICEHAYHLYVIWMDPDTRDRRFVFESLRERGIYAQIHYIPIHTQPYIRAVVGESTQLPSAERYYAGCLSLPMFPALTDGDQKYVIAALKTVCS